MPATTVVDIPIGMQSCPGTVKGGVDGLSGPCQFGRILELFLSLADTCFAAGAFVCAIRFLLR